RDGLHRHAGYDGFASGDAAFQATRAVGSASKCARSILQGDGIMYLRAAFGGVVEGRADFRAFHGMDADHRGDDAPIHAAVMMAVRPQARRDVERDDFHDAAEGVLIDLDLMDFVVHGFDVGDSRAAHIVFFGETEAFLIGHFGINLGFDAANLSHVAADDDTEFG